MLWIGTDHHNPATATDDAAFFTNFTYRCPNLHASSRQYYKHNILSSFYKICQI